MACAEACEDGGGGGGEERVRGDAHNTRAALGEQVEWEGEGEGGGEADEGRGGVDSDADAQSTAAPPDHPCADTTTTITWSSG